MTQSTTIAAITGLVIGSVATVAAARMFAGTRTRTTSSTKGEEDTPPDGQKSRAVFGLLPAALAASAINSDDNVNFLSDMMNRLWPYINVSGSDMIRETVEPMFKDMLPGPLATLRFTKVDLGKVPMRIDNVVVHDLKDGTVQFDMDITWDSDSDIQLKADYVGSFGVKSIKLNGRMTFLLKPLTNVLPIVSAIQYAFTNSPKLELDFTGLANIADFSFIDKSIRAVMQEVMASMVVLPNRMMYKMDLLSDYREFYQHPVGVARITCVRGRDFVTEKKTFGKHDIPDVYCKIKVGCEKVWKTSTVKDNLAPTWNEANDYLLCDNDQIVSIEAWDEDNGALDKDDFLGSANVTVGEILLAGKTLEVELQIDNKGTGSFVTLHCDVLKLTLSELTSLQGPAQPNQLAGLLTVIVTKALDLPLKKKDASSFVKVTCGGQEFVTGAVVDAPGYDAINPVYDIAFRVPLIGEATESTVKFELMNADKVLGEIIVKHADLVTATNQTISKRQAIGSDGAAIEFLVTLAGFAKSDGVDTPLSKDPTPSNAGTNKDKVRVSVISAHGFKVQKKGFLKKDDIPDVYCQIKFGSSPKVYRTPTIKNEVKPVWKDASSEYQMSSNNQVIIVDVYDENRKGEDDYLGNARITVGKVLLGGGLMELELQEHGAGTGAFILLRCDKI
jgi:Ca2+-dependent lipid-binding protein